jgi:hypothetical protein
MGIRAADADELGHSMTTLDLKDLSIVKRID